MITLLKLVTVDKMGLDEMGVEETGLDDIGVDEMGSRQIENKPKTYNIENFRPYDMKWHH